MKRTRSMDYRIISIGALSVHELWNRQGQARTPHATTTLVRSGDRTILVDPGLPQQVITARLAERAGIEPDDISDVFLTNFRPAHRMGLLAFPRARWLISEAEREAVGQGLVERFQQTEDEAERETLQQEIALLKRCVAAPDKLADHVDLFPLPGFTPGTTGLLLSHPRTTTLIAGDAIATIEHLEQGRVLRGAYDANQAQESIVEALEIADVIIPGHDNVAYNPTRRF
ncbi:MAG: MBL fold metallo-hydrolase [Phycisphaeraceae bacterium]